VRVLDLGRRTRNAKAALRNEMLGAILRSLPERERGIMPARCGLNGHEPLTLPQLARQRGCSREWVRQIEVLAVKMLRLRLNWEE
jgi:RNA polymerase primary sigma factor